jgi:hypothetical protein
MVLESQREDSSISLCATNSFSYRDFRSKGFGFQIEICQLVEAYFPTLKSKPDLWIQCTMVMLLSSTSLYHLPLTPQNAQTPNSNL